MTGIELVVGALVLLVAGVGAAAAAVARSRDRYNRVVPGVPTRAPRAWAGAHTPEARLHRRLRDAVAGAHAAAPGRDGALGAARTAVEEEALALDERLVVVAAVGERDRGALLVELESQVAALEQAVTAMATRDARASGMTEVDRALERVRLLGEARDEVDRVERRARGEEPTEDPGGTTAQG